MHTALQLSALVLLGFGCQWLAWRRRQPAILFLLIAGLLLGPVTGLLKPDEFFGPMLLPGVQLGVAIVLFEGSLTLRFSEIRGLKHSILLLVTVGAAITVMGIALTAHHLLGLDWPLALLLGALNCVTGPTVIAPLLRAVRPTERIAQLLRWEGIIIDPLGALIALLVFQGIVIGAADRAPALLLLSGVTGTLLGLGAAFLLARALVRQWVPDYLENFLVLATLLATFTTADAVARDSGLLAVTIMGIALANMRGVDVEHILHFKETLATVLLSLMFLLLSARLEIPGVGTFFGGLALLVVATAFVRPLAVLASTLGSPLTWKERAMVAYVSPRGIVAAAVSALFALELEAHRVDGAQQLVQLTFMLILGTVILQSTTAGRVAALLGVQSTAPRGVLIVGSSAFARMLAGSLIKQGFPTLIADDDWNGIRESRMQGIPTWYGNPVSEHAAERLPLGSTRWLLSLSTRMEMNSLACLRYRPEFGRQNVLRLRVFGKGEAPRHAHAGALQTPALFGPEVTHSGISELLARGWKLRTTRVSEQHPWTRASANGRRLLLFAVDERDTLYFASETLKLTPGPGWRATFLDGGSADGSEPVREPAGEPAQAG